MTLFEKIHRGEIPAEIVFEDEHCVAFRDIQPQAPVHILITPRKVLTRVGEAGPDDRELLGALLLAAGEVARRLGVDDPGSGGYRLVINHGRDGGESVAHLHVHLLAGRAMGWPPG